MICLRTLLQYSRLQFMQRAAASSSPLASTPTQTPDHHSAKRQKLSNGAATPSSTGTSTPIPIADDSSPGLPWNAAGETEWVLNLPQTIRNGQSEIVESSDEDELWSSSRPVGRQSYGSFKRPKKSLATSTTNAEEELSELESGEEEEEMHPLRPMKRPKDREKEEEAQGRRMDRMNLSRMGGVSGSSSMSGAGMTKRKDQDKNRPKSGRGPYGQPSDSQRVKQRRTT